MNTLRLNFINLHAPYRVWQKTGKPDHYYFVSDSYHPDFIVGTEKKIYPIETKGNDKLFDKNVRQKQTAAVEWTRKINELKPEERMNREWEYVLISEDNFYGLSANGATITDICDRCKVSLSAAMGELFI